MSTPTFSIVVPSYNYAHFLGPALDSVLAQERDDLQIIVVDDASQDDTPAVAERYADHIEYLRNEENLGAGGAWCRGIKHARGRYLLKLDADDRLLPGHLDAFEAAFEAHPEAGMVFSSVQTFDERDGRTRIERITEEDGFLDAQAFRRKLLRRFFFRMPGSALRMAALEGHGLPDPRLFQVHDWEFFLRVSRGWGAVLLERPLAIYRVHEASITSVARSGERLENDLEYWIRKASEPGESELEPAELDVLRGSFGIVMVLHRFGSKLDPSTYARFLKAYGRGARLALAGGAGQFGRMNRALAQEIGKHLARRF